uniref:Uncharacterized protein n=1 Tax=Anguilla anguilla TaxID=7936 RepID=A0A0E9V4G3_ANGAN
MFKTHPLQATSREGESHLGVLEMAGVHSPEPLTHGYRFFQAGDTVTMWWSEKCTAGWNSGHPRPGRAEQ